MKVPIGRDLDAGELRLISEVQRGAGCNCECPGCRNRLVAKRYKDKSDHFAHYQSKGSDSALPRLFSRNNHIQAWFAELSEFLNGD